MLYHALLVFVTRLPQYVTSPYLGVNIRKWFTPKGLDTTLRPGYGIFLKVAEWSKLEDVMNVVQELVPELQDAKRCCDMHEHQMAAFLCTECNPYGHMHMEDYGH